MDEPGSSPNTLPMQTREDVTSSVVQLESNWVDMNCKLVQRGHSFPFQNQEIRPVFRAALEVRTFKEMTFLGAEDMFEGAHFVPFSKNRGQSPLPDCDSSTLTMDFNPDDPDTWPADAESWYQVSYTAVTIANRRVPFPPENYYAIYGSVFNRDPHHLSLYTADTEHVSDLLASLPQWEFTGETGDNPRTWRVIWPYHPVISTFSTGSKIHTHSANFAVIEELSEHVQEEIPETLDSNRDCVIFHKTLPLAIFHSNQTVRWKFANHLDRLFQEHPLTPFLASIRNNQTGIPAVPDNVTRRITTALELALQVAQGKVPPYSEKTVANGPHILLILNVGPRLPIANHFSPMSISTAAPAKAPSYIPAAKSRVLAASMATLPIPPPQFYTSEEVTTPTVATPTVLPETATLSHLPSTSSAPEVLT
eukprot:symbB.v1.2.040600.t1/scaffold7365.1/size11661/1